MILFIIICSLTFTNGKCALLSSLSALVKSELEFKITKDGSSAIVRAMAKQPSSDLDLDISNYIQFYLFTRNNLKGLPLQPDDDTSILNPQFNPKLETKILIHGFANSISSEFITTLKQAYLSSGRYNVIVVDWSRLCRPPFYVSAVINARRVGARTARLVRRLHDRGVDLTTVHLLGYSVGAHIAGMVGHHLADLPPLGRITGLDPAKPMFERQNASDRLSADDASFVDCIHTCGGYLGVWEPLCSADYYPNAGTIPQPGCLLDIFGVCSHQRAFLYFAESVNKTNVFPSVRCAAVENYSPVRCSGEVTAVMGEYTDHGTRGVFHAGTAPAPPYSKGGAVSLVSSLQQFSWYFH